MERDIIPGFNYDSSCYEKTHFKVISCLTKLMGECFDCLKCDV